MAAIASPPPCNKGPALGKTPAAWSAGPARRMQLETSPLGADPDGNARWLVRVRFASAVGSATNLLKGGDIEFHSSRGVAQWQTRTRFGGPAAIVSTTSSGPLAVRATSKDPNGIADARVEIDTRQGHVAPVVAKALGPHLVQLGWFPAAQKKIEVSRAGPDGKHIVCTLMPPSSTCRDASVRPAAAYRYTVTELGGIRDSLKVSVRDEAPSQSLDVVRGKGMWLRFSPDPLDDDAYSNLDAAGIVDRAKRAGLRYIELRIAYGEFWEITPAAKTRIDALIDAAADAGIAVLAWTVPRAPSFDDLALNVAAANYRTARGTRVAGLAIDLERGDEYMGEGAQARSAIAEYSRVLRQALGRSYLIVGTVEDPYLGTLTNRDFPFSIVAENSNVIQPMMYWRFYRKGLDAAAAGTAVRQSIQALRREAGRPIAINMGGQTSSLGPCGAPPPSEITASLDESLRAGVIGETFFDWFGTSDVQWDAISSFPWESP